jgi:hypothetical protein
MKIMFNFQLIKEHIDDFDEVATNRTQIFVNNLQPRFPK